MAANVEFKDFSIEVAAALDETTLAWLLETANEVTAQAQRTCVMEDDVGKQLKGSYANKVDEGKGEATVGTPLEAGYWEEWGTGEYAAHGDGRKGWWVYVKGQGPSSKASAEYRDREEAQAVADSMRADGLDAYATNGRRPNYTLEKAFEATKNPSIAHLKQMLKERMAK